MVIYCSTQHPSEIQLLISKLLNKKLNSITVEVRRMGGAFGGKETQASQWACIAALTAERTGRPAKIRLDRDVDMLATGKRHDFSFKYRVGLEMTEPFTAWSLKWLQNAVTPPTFQNLSMIVLS